MTFQITVMKTAIIILIITLCFIGLALYKQKYSADYPPVFPNCPDYWMDSSGNGANCTNPKNLGNANCAGPMDFTLPQWAGQNGKCSKYKWAKQCNLSWDGISDNTDLCGS